MPSVSVVRVAGEFAAVAGDDDVAGAETHPCIYARTEVGVTAVAGEATELTRKPTAIPLADAPGETDVLAGPVELAVGRRLAGEGVQSVDSLLGNSHSV
jgi:hypothetical protein